MKKILLIFCSILLFGGCGKRDETLEMEPTAENFARYISEEYRYGESGEFVERYIDNTYSTNLYLINLLKDSYSGISVISCDEAGALLDCDGTLLRMDIAIAGGKISKIQLREGGHDGER